MVRLTDRPDMTLDVYRGRKTTIQQQQQHHLSLLTLNFALSLWSLSSVSCSMYCIVSSVVDEVY